MFFALADQRVGDFPVHTHSNVEIMIVLEGQAEHFINGEWVSARPGDVFVVVPPQPHGVRNGGALFHHINLSCTPDCDRLLTPGLRFLPGKNELFDSSHVASFHASPEEFRDIVFLLTRMAEVYQSGGEVERRVLLRADFTTLLILLAQAYANRPEAEKPTVDRVKMTVEYMKLHYAEPLTLRQLAKRSALSESQFMRRFSQTYAMSAFAFLAELRMENARKLLENTNLAVGEIALRCGCRDSAQFCRIFHRFFGETPLAFRRRFRM